MGCHANPILKNRENSYAAFLRNLGDRADVWRCRAGHRRRHSSGGRLGARVDRHGTAQRSLYDDPQQRPGRRSTDRRKNAGSEKREEEGKLKRNICNVPHVQVKNNL